MGDHIKKFDEKKWNESLLKASEDARDRHRITIENLKKIAKSVDAARLLVAVYANLGFGPAEHFEEHLYGTIPAKFELLAYHLYPYFESSHEKRITPFHTNECINILDELFRTRQQQRLFSKTETGYSDTADFLVDGLKMYAEIVRGSAFPEQTEDEISAVQGKFEQWFTDRAGIGPKRTVELSWAIIRTIEELYNSSRAENREYADSFKGLWEKAKKKHNSDRTAEDHYLLRTFRNAKTAWFYGYVQRLNEVSPDTLPITPHNIDFIGSKPSESEWDALCSLIGLTIEKRKQMSDPIEVRQTPMLVFPDKSVILLDISNGLDVIWDKFERIAKSDASFYDKRYQRKKAKWLEQKVAECLMRIFPKENIYTNLSYPDPDKTYQANTEIDHVITWGPFLILIECKAKQFRMESQLGDVGRLVTDVKANLSDAFDQARRAVRYIDGTTRPEFKELSSDRILSVNKDKIYRIYMLTISQHHLAGLTNNLGDFREIGLFTEREFPLSLCLADLDTITQFSDAPDIFLHYIERRLDIQKQPVEVISDELSLFGAYLESRLSAKRLWGQDGKPVTGFSLDGFDQKFDKWMRFKRGELEKAPEIKLDVPDEIHEILMELRNGEDDSARWIAFSLLDMPDRGLAAISQMITEIRKAKPTPGMFRRVVHQEDDTVISLTASIDVSPSQLRERTQFRAIIEKYRRKAKKSIGIGVFLPDTSKPFNNVTWIEGAWEYDQELENIIESEPESFPLTGQKLPGRNDPCICGSGKKFKKCCRTKIEEARRKAST